MYRVFDYYAWRMIGWSMHVCIPFIWVLSLKHDFIFIHHDVWHCVENFIVNFSVYLVSIDKITNFVSWLNIDKINFESNWLSVCLNVEMQKLITLAYLSFFIIDLNLE